MVASIPNGESVQIQGVWGFYVRNRNDGFVHIACIWVL